MFYGYISLWESETRQSLFVFHVNALFVHLFIWKVLNQLCGVFQSGWLCACVSVCECDKIRAVYFTQIDFALLNVSCDHLHASLSAGYEVRSIATASLVVEGGVQVHKTTRQVKSSNIWLFTAPSVVTVCTYNIYLYHLALFSLLFRKIKISKSSL